MTGGLDRVPGLPAPAGSQATLVEQTRAAAEVAAAVMAARQVPRDPDRARRVMQRVCSEYGLASQAFYAYRQGGSDVHGPTVTLMRELAAVWGNLDYGTQELARDQVQRRSEVRAFCRDLETNTYSSRTVFVEWVQYTANARKDLDKVREIDQNNNSVAGRALREQIAAILPAAFVHEAKALCTETLARGDGTTSIADRVREAVDVFGKARPPITQATLEAKVGRPAAEWDGGDVARLEVLFQSLRNREITREEAFPDEQTRAVTSEDLRAQATAADDEEAAAELDRRRFAQTEGKT